MSSLSRSLRSSAMLGLCAAGALAFAQNAAAQDHSKMDHSHMDHSKMDHSKMNHGAPASAPMDHSKMDHSKMDHAGMDHSMHNPAVHALHMAAANPNRDSDKARDAFRHPVETLSFFQFQPDMKIGEYAPGGGWYSHFLANFVGPKGKVVGLFFDTTKGPFTPEQQAKTRSNAAAFGAEQAKFSGKDAALFGGFTLETIPAGEAGTFDRIIIMRMLHNLKRWNMAEGELAKIRTLLKDDGLVGVEQHRAKDGASAAYTDGSKGYLHQSDVIAMMEKAGFELVDASEINANPKDTADHAEGVWEMPPILRTKRADLADKGETDRMTLLFKKAK